MSRFLTIEEITEQGLQGLLPEGYRLFTRFKAGDLFSELPDYPWYLVRKCAVSKYIFEARIRSDLRVFFYAYPGHRRQLHITLEQIPFAHLSHDPIRQDPFPSPFSVLEEIEFKNAWKRAFRSSFEQFIQPYQ